MNRTKKHSITYAITVCLAAVAIFTFPINIKAADTQIVIGYVTDVTMNNLQITTSRDNVYNFNKTDRTDTSKVRSTGLLLGERVRVTYKQLGKNNLKSAVKIESISTKIEASVLTVGKKSLKVKEYNKPGSQKAVTTVLPVVTKTLHKGDIATISYKGNLEIPSKISVSLLAKAKTITGVLGEVGDGTAQFIRQDGKKVNFLLDKAAVITKTAVSGSEVTVYYVKYPNETQYRATIIETAATIG